MISIRVSTSPSTDIDPDSSDSLTASLASLASYSWSNELTDDDDETEEGDENG